MKRACACLLLAFLAAPGCMNLPFGAAKNAPKEAAPAPKPPPPSVMPDDINPENAHEKVEAFNKELSYDASGMGSMPTPPADTAKH